MRSAMHLNLKTKCDVLVLLLVAVSLLLLANTTTSYWTLQEHLVDFMAEVSQDKEFRLDGSYDDQELRSVRAVTHVRGLPS
jgi:hypothetical protein